MPAATNVWIVLIRGINIGGRWLAMAKLVALMEKAGCTDVQTYIQSGNAVCKSRVADAPTLAAKIARAIEASEGYLPSVMVLSRADFEAAATANPYPVDDHKALHLFFCAEAPADLAPLERVRIPSEQYAQIGTTFYFYAPAGFGLSKLAGSFEKLTKVRATARNWRTVTALRGMIAAAEAATSPPPMTRAKKS